MMCENEYCIYQNNRACMPDIISIDEFGKCSECIIPNIPHDFFGRAQTGNIQNYRIVR